MSVEVGFLDCDEWANLVATNEVVYFFLFLRGRTELSIGALVTAKNNYLPKDTLIAMLLGHFHQTPKSFESMVV